MKLLWSSMSLLNLVKPDSFELNARDTQLGGFCRPSLVPQLFFIAKQIQFDAVGHGCVSCRTRMQVIA